MSPVEITARALHRELAASLLVLSEYLPDAAPPSTRTVQRRAIALARELDARGYRIIPETKTP